MGIACFMGQTIFKDIFCYPCLGLLENLKEHASIIKARQGGGGSEGNAYITYVKDQNLYSPENGF